MRLEEGGWVRQTRIRELPISKAMAGVNMRLKTNAVREMHWHKEAAWSYMLKGRARITAVDEEGRTFADDVSEGDLWYFTCGIPHAIQALESEIDGCEFLLVFNDGAFFEDSTFLITNWLAHTPNDILAKNFGVPELHWHPNGDEWQYDIDGQGRMTVFGWESKAQTFNYQAGDVGYVPFTMGHYMENTGTTTLRFLEMFRTPAYADVPLAQWMALTPHALVRAHLKIDETVLAGLPAKKTPVLPG